VELIVAAVFLAIFLGIYAVLYRRAERAGRQPRVRAGWLVAIIGLAALALLIGALSH
jgi:hypothetical protein